MKIDSVRSLKAEVKQDVLRIPSDPSQSVDAMSMGEGQDLLQIGIGITRAEESDQFKLAVRLESAEDLNRPQMSRILALAHGEVDVRVVGRISSLEPDPIDASQSRHSTLRMGSTVGVEGTYAVGTAGVFVRDRSTREICLLSNNHVLADCNSARIGAEIYFHSDYGPERVGRLKAFHRISQGARNEVDCAIALLDPNYPVDMSSLSGGGRFTGVANRNTHAGMAVTKVGRTTGRTYGRVSATEMDIWVGFGDLGTVYFTNQTEINGTSTGFSAAGDSGSLVMDSSLNGIGLLFAGSPFGVTYCNHIGKVLDTLNIDLINSR